MRVLACPGQGSQSAGFLAGWLNALPRLDETLKSFSELVGIDLIQMGTSASEDEIRSTEIAQPLIVASSIGIARNLPTGSLTVDGVVGHSVGEFAAAAIAGILGDEDAIRLVALRGRAMARASQTVLTGMAAAVGGEESEVRSRAQELDLELANHNGPGQLVFAGRIESINQFAAEPPSKCRVVPLKVAGAFHTHYMESAVAEVHELADSIQPKDPNMAIWSNRDGGLITKGADFLEAMVTQIANPVRWDACLISISGCSRFVELPPAGVLAGIAKRQLPEARVVALRNPEDLEQLEIA